MLRLYSSPDFLNLNKAIQNKRYFELINFLADQKSDPRKDGFFNRIDVKNSYEANTAIQAELCPDIFELLSHSELGIFNFFETLSGCRYTQEYIIKIEIGNSFNKAIDENIKEGYFENLQVFALDFSNQPSCNFYFILDGPDLEMFFETFRVWLSKISDPNYDD